MLGKNRTFNLQIRSLMLYPIKLQAFTGVKGLEPLIDDIKNRCLTNLAILH